jgi:hypothetical protein
MSCTFVEKGATGLELVALLSRYMKATKDFSYELHFSSRYVQLQQGTAMSCTFLEKHTIGLELVPLL